MKRAAGILIMIFLTINLYAQTIKPIGRFLTDSTKLGDPVKYSLSISHIHGTQVLFPDTAYNFSPFELIEKEYFPTKTTNGISFDSAVYILRSFNIQPTQKLSLPVFVSENGDSSTIYATRDSVYLKEFLPESPINEEFKEDTDFQKLSLGFNYPYYIFYFVLTIVFASVIYFFFGTIIRRRFRLLTIRLDHNRYLKTFHKLENDFNSSKTPVTLEKALSSWKAYHERLENKPIKTYTTTEIINLYNQEDLKVGLNIIDRAIYGGLITNEAGKAIVTLRRFSVRQYHKRKREITNV